MLKKYRLLLFFYLQDAKYRVGTTLVPYLLLVAYFPLKVVKKPLAYKLLMASHRGNYNSIAAYLIKRNLGDISRIIHEETVVPNERECRHILGRSIVLKKPLLSGEVQEKGILLIKFTETFAYFLRHVDCERLLEEYHVILEPSWTGQALEEVLGWTKYKSPVYIQTADAADYRFIASLNSNLVPIRAGAGDYVDYRIFKPIGAEKEYDCLCIANFCSHKRLHAYVLAVSKLARKNPGFRAALVCASMGSLRSKVLSLIELLNLEDHLDVIEGCNQVMLNELVDKSVVNMLLSFREGASKVLSESLFADVPSIVLRENIGVNKDHFNRATGMVVSERELPAAITRMKSELHTFSPRAWAMENITPEATLQKLITTICAHERDGVAFSSKVFAKVNVPEARYMYAYEDMDYDLSKRLIVGYIHHFEDAVEQQEQEQETAYPAALRRGAPLTS